MDRSGPGTGGKHDVRHGNVIEGDASQYLRARRPMVGRLIVVHGNAVIPLRHFDQGRRYHGAGQCRPYVRLHGAVRPDLLVCGDAGEALGDSML